MGNFYKKKLSEDGLEQVKRDNLQRNFWVQTFLKDAKSLEVRVDSRDAGSEVRLPPEGMMWEEADQLKRRTCSTIPSQRSCFPKSR